MKKWHKRSIVILTLGLLGVGALSMRPALIPDTAKNYLDCSNTAQQPLVPEDSAHSLNLEYSWNLTTPPPNTLLQHEQERPCNAFSLLKSQTWNIRIFTEGGHLKVTYDSPVLHALDSTQSVHTTYYAIVLPHTRTRYLPNGRKTTEYDISLLCVARVTPCFWQQPVQTRAIQQLRVNLALGTVDIVAEYPFICDNSYTQIVAEGPPHGLPSLFCGNEREQALQFLLYELADVVGARYYGQALHYIEKAKRLINQYCDPELEWPLCWGDAAAEARRGANMVELILTRMHHEQDFDCPELYEFINSPDFTRIFGPNLQLREQHDLGDDFDTGTDDIEFELITEDAVPSDNETPMTTP